VSTLPETAEIAAPKTSFVVALEERLREQPHKVALYLFGLSMLIQFLYLSQYAVSPFFWVPQLDGMYHDRWAQEIVAGNPRPTPYFRAPLYYYFLAGIYSVFGQNFWAVRLIQAGIGAISCVLLYHIGIKANVRPAGSLLAALLMVFYGPLVFQFGELHLTSLEVFFDLLLVLFALNRGRPWAFASGLALGISALVRPNILVVIPVVLWWLWYREREINQANPLQRWIPLAALFVLGASFGPATATIRNGRVSGGDYIFIASQGPITFYSGNRFETDGFTPSTPTRYRFDTVYEDSFELYAQRAAEEALGRKLTVNETQKYWTQRGVNWWTANPGAGIALTLKKWGMVWNHREIRNNTAFDYVRAEWTPVLWGCFIGFWLVGPFAALGMVVTWNRPALRFFTVFALVYMLSFLPFMIADRYRLPVVPLLLLLGIGAVEWLAEKFALRKTDSSAGRSLFPALAGLAAMAIFVNGNWFATSTPKLWAMDYWGAGNRYKIQRKYAEAEAQYRRAANLDPQNHEIWNNLGESQYYQERFPEAVASFENALRLRPDYSDGYYNLALCCLALHDTNRAQSLLEEALRRDPENKAARKELDTLRGTVAAGVGSRE
jgi:4-amino-4-deoxy-L-arabinose transferase-like glycosyltransferase